jgi:release factor glutamine methyltransferase
MEKYLNFIVLALSERKTEDPHGEVELIKCHLRDFSEPIKEVKRILTGIEKGIPVPFILGYTIVMSAKIGLNKHVLNPGPETKDLTEKVINYANLINKPTVLDVCTGSGAIAIAVAKSVSVAICSGTDISRLALETAHNNSLLNNVSVDFRCGDLFKPFYAQKFDIIVANPPYVKSLNIEKLPSFIRDFAPLTAIDGGCDGLKMHTRILDQAHDYLQKNGVLFLECEDNQETELFVLFQRYKWSIVESYQNSFGKIRGFCLNEIDNPHRHNGM